MTVEVGFGHELRVGARPTTDVTGWPTDAALGSLFHTSRWLTSKRAQPGTDSFLVTAESDTGVEAAIYLQIVHDPATYESYNIHDLLFVDVPVFGVPRNAPPGPTRDEVFPNAVITFPGYEGRPLVRPGGEAAVPDLYRYATEIAEQHGAHLIASLYHPCLDGGHEDTASAVDAHFHALHGHWAPLTQRWRVTVGEDGLDGVVARLPRKRRTEIGRERRRLRDRGIRVTSNTMTSADIESIVELRCSLQTKYGHPCDAAAERAKFEHLVATWGEGLHLARARVGDAVVSYGILLDDGREVHALQTGSHADPEISRLCYFAVNYYEGCELTARLGRIRLDLGISHGEPKRRRSATPLRLRGAFADLSGRLSPDIERETRRMTERFERDQ